MPKTKGPERAPISEDEKETGKSRVSQADVPGVTLDQALRVPQAIAEEYAFKATKPLHVAAAMNMQPSTGAFRTRCGAAIAYGLTSGGYNAPEIKIEPLGLRIVRPLIEGDDLAARREAMLNPRVFGEFLRKYDGAPLPRNEIARNVLLDMGVPADRTADVLEMLIESAEDVGFIRQIKDKRYIDLQTPPSQSAVEGGGNGLLAAGQRDATLDDPSHGSENEDSEADPFLPDRHSAERATNARRVFVTHGKNKAFIEPIRKLLSFGELEAVVSIDKHSVSQPVPDKVMADMRSCGAAIIHVDAEQKLIDHDAKEHLLLNPNVLIEIGAAMALYGRRFILLVRDGVQLPSNLQGLYEVRYKGESLDGEATIRLLEAINDIKNHPAPLRYSADGKASSE